MMLACDKCGITDFAGSGRASMSFICPDCLLVMCSTCAGRTQIDGLSMLCCYNCQSAGIRVSEVWADRLFPRGRGPDRSDEL